MAKGLRLDPNDPKDKKFLGSKVDKVTGKSLLQLDFEACEKSAKQFNETIDPQNPNSSLNARGTEKAVGRYGNKRTFEDGMWFDSKWESQCWMILKYDLQQKGIIYDLSRDRDQCHFIFEHNNIRIAQALFDFSFSLVGIERRVIADAKSKSTLRFQRFRWQRQMMLAFFDLPVIVFLEGKTDIYKDILHLKKYGL